jgi:16S rRNA (adenine1518-N6/adenine1519-N6)-dimethyltransferase
MPERESLSGHRMRKRFGQHFLVDGNAIDAIIRAIAPQPEDVVVEIGPGGGALTHPLAARVNRLHVVEIDRDLAARMAQQFDPAHVTVHCADVLRFDLTTLGSTLRVVGNLPYNISTPILFELCSIRNCLRDVHVMLQREVVDRMVATPGSAAYGRLSVALQYRFEIERVVDVPATAFAPPPKVESAVVRLRPASPRAELATDEAVLDEVLIAAFTQRRKTLRNGLRRLLSDTQIASLGIDPGTRGETLGFPAFVRIANALARLRRRVPGG